MTEEKQTVDDLYADDDAIVATPDIVGDNGGTPPAKDDTPSADTSPTSDEQVDDRPGIEMYLAEYGIEGGMIKFEDGESVHINELTPQEQHTVLTSLAKDSRPTIEQQNDLNEDEISFLNMVRESGKGVTDVVAGLANEQLDKIKVFEDSQSVDWDNMGVDAVYLAFLKSKNPDMNDEELQDDLDKARETKTYESVVKGIREDFKDGQKRKLADSEASISKKFDESIEGDRQIIVEAIAPVQEIAGFEINDDQKNALLGDILELNDVGDSLLLENIFSDPQTILEAAWFQKYGKGAISEMENYYKQELSKAYSRGRAEALGKLPESDIPSRIGGLAVKKTKTDNFNASPDAQTVDDLYDDEN